MKCDICGKEIERSLFFNGNFCSVDCFNVDFWNNCLDSSAIIIDGECYHIGPETCASYNRGFGGRKFFIKMMETGDVIETTNLRHNGTVPKYRKVKNNAEFLRRLV